MSNVLSFNKATAPALLPHQPLRNRLHAIRDGRDADGKMRPAHRVTEHLLEEVGVYAKQHGKFLHTNSGRNYWLDGIQHLLIPLSSPSVHTRDLLHLWGLNREDRHYKQVLGYLNDMAEKSEAVNLPVGAAMRHGKQYWWNSPTTMIRVSVLDGEPIFEEVPTGADGVILVPETPDAQPQPSLAVLAPHLERLRPSVGRTCLRPSTALPSADLTTRWDEDAYLSAAQQQLIYHGRLLLLYAGDRVPLWPIKHITGPAGAGKSLINELEIAYRTGDPEPSGDGKVNSVEALANILKSVHRPYLDNVDGCFSGKDGDDTINLLCQAATGGTIRTRKLYTDEEQVKVRIRCDLSMSSIVMPYDRHDVQRRVLPFSVRTARPGEVRSNKGTLIKRVLANRVAILAEFLLRAANMLQAYAQHEGDSFDCVTLMPEYEEYTLICARYEGNEEEVRAAWSGLMRRYRQTISESNPMVMAIRLWLGAKEANAGLAMRAGVLLAKVQTVYDATGQTLPYASAAKFGAHLRKNDGPLAILGYRMDASGNKTDYSFHPSPEELEECRDLYRAMVASAAARPSNKRRERQFEDFEGGI